MPRPVVPTAELPFARSDRASIFFVVGHNEVGVGRDEEPVLTILNSMLFKSFHFKKKRLRIDRLSRQYNILYEDR